MHLTSARRFAHVACQLDEAEPPFVAEHRAAIDAHWDRRSRENPKFFDGAVLMLTGATQETGPDGPSFAGQCAAVGFRVYLYWREHGRTPPLMNVFGGAIVRASCGRILAVEGGRDTINEGWWLFAGGFIDLDDVVRAPDDAPGGRSVDVVGQIFRETQEEMGLSRPRCSLAPGWIVTERDRGIGLLRILDIAEPADALLPQIRSHIARETDGELAGAMAIAPQDAIGDERFAPYCRASLEIMMREAAR